MYERTKKCVYIKSIDECMYKCLRKCLKTLKRRTCIDLNKTTITKMLKSEKRHSSLYMSSFRGFRTRQEVRENEILKKKERKEGGKNGMAKISLFPYFFSFLSSLVSLLKAIISSLHSSFYSFFPSFCTSFHRVSTFFFHLYPISPLLSLNLAYPPQPLSLYSTPLPNLIFKSLNSHPFLSPQSLPAPPSFHLSPFLPSL